MADGRLVFQDIARKVDAADVYIDLDRKDAKKQWDQIKVDYPYGFDAVCECTGVASIATDAINYVKKGGALMICQFTFPNASQTL